MPAQDFKGTLTGTGTLTADETKSLSGKLDVPGAWTTPAFNAGNFTADGAMTWTVGAGDIGCYAYTIAGKVMTVIFDIYTSTIGGTPSTYLLMAIPGTPTATKTFNQPILITDNGVNGIGIALVVAGATAIRLYKDATQAANWAASTDNTRVSGQITFEID